MKLKVKLLSGGRTVSEGELNLFPINFAAKPENRSALLAAALFDAERAINNETTLRAHFEVVEE